jgi:3-dehydroquinate synthetase
VSLLDRSPKLRRYMMFDGGKVTVVAHTPDLVRSAGRLLADFFERHGIDRAFFVVDPEVWRLYGAKLAAAIDALRKGFDVVVAQPRHAGERMKTEREYLRLVRKVLAWSPGRGDLPVVVGGGAAHDLGALVASTVRRGVPYVVVPTTLTSMIDAALSPKSAINIGPFKNGLGTNHVPMGVLWDPAFLATLDETSVLTGMAELVKIAAVRSAKLFEILEVYGTTLVDLRFQCDLAPGIVDAAARTFLRMKYEPRDRPESLRSFGHGFSRKIEGSSRYRVSHGEAASVEMAIAGTLAHQLNLLPRDDLDRLHALIARLGLPLTNPHACAPELWKIFARKYDLNQPFSYVILKKLGEATFLDRFSQADLRDAIAFTAARARVFAPAPQARHILGRWW